MIQVTERKGAHGEFLGAVVAELRLNYFESIYNSITRLRHQSFQLLLRDGTVLVSQLAGLDRSGKILAGSPWYEPVAHGGEARFAGAAGA